MELTKEQLLNKKELTSKLEVSDLKKDKVTYTF